MPFLVLILLPGLPGKPGPQLASAQDMSYVQPDQASVGRQGSWTVQFIAGEAGISVGGGIKVQFPPSWFVFPWPVPKELQIENSALAHYVSSSTSRVGAEATLTISSRGIDGQYHRFGRTFVVQVEDVPLLAGDTISVTLANTQASVVAGIDPIGIAADPEGDGVYTRLSDSPRVLVRPGPAVALRVIAPSQAVVGQPFSFRVVALDEYANATGRFQDTVTFGSAEPGATLPPPYTFTEEDQGIHLFNAAFQAIGVQTLSLTTGSSVVRQPVQSNPVWTVPTRAEKRIFWGDLHSHSENSHDGAGQAEAAFLYARQVAGLDFYALTDHSQADGSSVGLTDEEWRDLQNLVEAWYDPGSFVTFLGYEWSGPAPYGHRNIIYRTASGPIFRRDIHSSIVDLWQVFAYAGLDVLTIPHHTGIIWGSNELLNAPWELAESSPYVSWDYRDDRFQRAAEVYSLHGASEFYGNLLAYEEVANGLPPAFSNPGPYYLRDGWAAGQKLGVTSSSDNHLAHPGLEHGGLTAVYAEEPTREGLFDAVTSGRTYATTGARILLEFRADEHWMGEAFRTDQPPILNVSVAGTSDLEWVQIIKYDGAGYQALYHLSHPDTQQLSICFADPALMRDSTYYVRVKQVNQINGRDVMAWSSPIWINPTANLKVTVDDGRESVTAGETLTYTIAYGNYGLVAAEDVHVRNAIPAHTSLPPWPSLIARAGSSSAAAGRATIDFDVGDLAPGEEGELAFTVVVEEDPPWGSTTLTNTVTISSTSAEVDYTDNQAVDVDELPRSYAVCLPLLTHQDVPGLAR